MNINIQLKEINLLAKQSPELSIALVSEMTKLMEIHFTVLYQQQQQNGPFLLIKTCPMTQQCNHIKL